MFDFPVFIAETPTNAWAIFRNKDGSARIMRTHKKTLKRDEWTCKDLTPEKAARTTINFAPTNWEYVERRMYRDPVLVKGKFRCSLKGVSVTYKAIDIAEAKAKICARLKLNHKERIPEWARIKVEVIEPTIRMFS